MASLKNWLVDFAVAGDLGGGGHGWSDRDLWPLHMWKSAGSLSFGDSRVIGFCQLLLGILY